MQVIFRSQYTNHLMKGYSLIVDVLIVYLIMVDCLRQVAIYMKMKVVTTMI